MIPRVIHYCWFGNARKPELIRRCIKSWEQVMPDFQIKCWGMDSFDFDSVPFVKEALLKQKWAFVADYVRLHALYHEGGIYLDTDVEVFKSFESFLDNHFFAGTDTRIVNGEQIFLVESAIMGAEKGCKYILKCMKFYQNRHFVLPNGDLDQTMIPDILSDILTDYDLKYKRINVDQILTDRMKIYSTDYFVNNNGELNEAIFAKHWNTFTWRDRGRFYSFCQKNDFLYFYSFVESCRIKVQSILK